MTGGRGIAISVASALLLGAFRYGHMHDIDPPGVLGDLWYGSVLGLVVYALAIFGVFLVYRWWALLPAVAPAAVNVYLYNFTSYVSPWREDTGADLSEQPALIFLVLLGIFLQASALSIGLLLRWAWERKPLLRGPEPS